MLMLKVVGDIGDLENLRITKDFADLFKSIF